MTVHNRSKVGEPFKEIGESKPTKLTNLSKLFYLTYDFARAQQPANMRRLCAYVDRVKATLEFFLGEHEAARLEELFEKHIAKLKKSEDLATPSGLSVYIRKVKELIQEELRSIENVLVKRFRIVLLVGEKDLGMKRFGQLQRCWKALADAVTTRQDHNEIEGFKVHHSRIPKEECTTAYEIEVFNAKLEAHIRKYLDEHPSIKFESIELDQLDLDEPFVLDSENRLLPQPQPVAGLTKIVNVYQCILKLRRSEEHIELRNLFAYVERIKANIQIILDPTEVERLEKLFIEFIANLKRGEDLTDFLGRNAYVTKVKQRIDEELQKIDHPQIQKLKEATRAERMNIEVRRNAELKNQFEIYQRYRLPASFIENFKKLPKDFTNVNELEDYNNQFEVEIQNYVVNPIFKRQAQPGLLLLN